MPLLNLLVTVFFSFGPGRGMIGRGRGGFGGRGRGRGRGRGALSRPVLTKEQLDNQLDAYMSKTKGHLDAELDAYMAQTDPETNDWSLPALLWETLVKVNTSVNNLEITDEKKPTWLMLEGPIRIDYGLNLPPVCAFSVFLLLFWYYIVWNPFFLWLEFGFILLFWGFGFFSPDFSLNMNMLAFFPPLPPLTCYICPDILTSLYPLGKDPEIIHQCSSLTPRFLSYSFVLYHSNRLLEVLRKSGVQNVLRHIDILM